MGVAIRVYGLIVGLLGVLALGALVQPRPVAPPQPRADAPDPERDALVRDIGVALRLVMASQACAGGDTGCQEDPHPGPASPLQRRIAQAARRALATGTPGFRDDCSGFVSAVLTAAGVPADGDTSRFFDLALEHGTLHHDPIPQVGDLVFFDDTHDRNRDGLWNDPLSHIGVVVDVSPEGVATFAHAGLGSGRALGVLDTRHPDVTHLDGERVNTGLRNARPGDPAGSRYNAGALWVGFAHVEAGQDWSPAVAIPPAR